MKTLGINIASYRLAFGLMAALCALIVISAVVPQDGWAEQEILDWKAALGGGYRTLEVLRLTRIYTSPLFFLVLGLLAVNLVAGNIRRFRTVYRTERTLVRARHLGSIVFHFSLVLVMAAVIGNYLLKFRGTFAVTEGQTVADVPQDYFSVFAGPLRGGSSERFALALEAVQEGLNEAGRHEESATIALYPGRSRHPLRAELALNRPLVWNDVEFHLGRSRGYSPEILVEDGDGGVRFRSFVRLATRRESGATIYSDFVALPEEDLRITVSILPHAEGGLIREVTVHQAGRLEFEGPLSEGEFARFGDYRLSIPRIRRWAYVDVAENPLQGTIFFGFWLGLAGLTMTFAPRVLGSTRRR